MSYSSSKSTFFAILLGFSGLCLSAESKKKWDYSLLEGVWMYQKHMLTETLGEIDSVNVLDPMSQMGLVFLPDSVCETFASTAGYQPRMPWGKLSNFNVIGREGSFKFTLNSHLLTVQFKIVDSLLSYSILHDYEDRTMEGMIETAILVRRKTKPKM